MNLFANRSPISIESLPGEMLSELAPRAAWFNRNEDRMQ